MKEESYSKKINRCEMWLADILFTIKKDLKREHLAKDKKFVNKNFLGKSFQIISKEELKDAYLKEIQSGNDALSEFICTRWLLKHTDIYDFFESHLKSVTDDFEKLTSLDIELQENLKKDAIKLFGEVHTFIFVLFNSVVFDDKVFNELEQLAIKATGVTIEQEQIQSLEKCKERYERKIKALVDKYEKKLSGFQKKYLNDIDKLQKQLSLLKEQHASRT